MAVDLTAFGRALAAPARSAILDVLMDGSTRPASELARVAGVRGPAASEHLALLVEVGLLRVESRGRQRRYRLADARVAEVLEQVGTLCPQRHRPSLRGSREQRELAEARLCYDHLAGRLGTAVTDAFVARGWLRERDLALTAPGRVGLARTGADVAALARSRRALTRACPDWTERRPHLAGAAGAAVAALVLERGWARRRASGRGLDVTSHGRECLRAEWGVALAGPAGCS